MNTARPTDPETCYNGRLRQATRRVTQFYDRRIASSGLKSTQLNILMHIDFLGKPTLKVLAQGLIMDLSALGHSLKPLERASLVELAADSKDGRARRVCLTRNGKIIMAEAMALWRKAQDELENIMGADKAQALHCLLGFVASEDFERAFRETKTVV